MIRDLTILAAARMRGGVCVAGIDGTGRWVRPVRAGESHQWNHGAITDHCLARADVVHGERIHVTGFGVTRFHLTENVPDPPHTEDWVIDPQHKPQLLRHLTEQEQEKFLVSYAQHDLGLLQPPGHHSLGLFQTESFAFHFTPEPNDLTVRAEVTIGAERVSDLPCADLAMRALGRRLLEGSGGQARALTEQDFQRHNKRRVCLTIGLSRLYQNRHWLMILGVHTLPALEVEVDYQRL